MSEEEFIKLMKEYDIIEMGYQNKNGEISIKLGSDGSYKVRKSLSNIEHIIKSKEIGFINLVKNGKQYVQIGDYVKEGQILAYINTRIQEEIEVRSDIEGKIKEVFVENNDVVDYGKKLFLIESEIK